MPKVSESKEPTLDFEMQAAREGYTFIIGLDEVGRGAIAGPVAVGAAVVRCDVAAFPAGLRDSKLLSEKKRELISVELPDWMEASAVGFASAEEIDALGITAMLGQAARRALLELHELGVPVADCLVLLDGSHDWLSPVLKTPLQVRTQVKADRDCATVAAASVLAKVARDAQMRELSGVHPAFGWESNKGYGSSGHYDAIREQGVTQWHRKTWIRA